MTNGRIRVNEGASAPSQATRLSPPSAFAGVNPEGAHMRQGAAPAAGRERPPARMTSAPPGISPRGPSPHFEPARA
jgi:hypothetical protein